VDEGEGLTLQLVVYIMVVLMDRSLKMAKPADVSITVAGAYVTCSLLASFSEINLVAVSVAQ
jgi:hypothetical protein